MGWLRYNSRSIAVNFKGLEFGRIGGEQKPRLVVRGLCESLRFLQLRRSVVCHLIQGDLSLLGDNITQPFACSLLS